MKKRILLSLFCLFALLGPRLGAAATPCGLEFVCHEALLKISRHASAAQIQAIFDEAGLTLVRYLPRSRIYHVALPAHQDTLETIAALGRRELILAVSPNGIVSSELLPDDSRFSEQWGLNNSGQEDGIPGADIGIDSVWPLVSETAPNIVVGIVDSGIDYTHPDLAENVWTNENEIPGNGIDDDANGYIDDVHGYDFYNRDGDPMDDDAHGTHVAGTVGAVGNNALGVSGVAWKTKLMALKFLNADGFGTMMDAAEATEYAIDNGADILNNSWGVSFTSVPLLGAITASDEAGMIYVTAAGNFGNDNDARPFFPANYDVGNILSVAAITRFDALAGFSDYGKLTVDLGAPGLDILSTVPTWYHAGDDDYEFFDGTSMASPHVVGAAALLWSFNPGYNHRQIINLLLQGVAPKAYLKDITLSGGTLNLDHSFDLAAGVINRPPVANAGSDQFKKVGETVQFLGGATDEDGDSPLFFEWALTVPEGSQSQLNFSNQANPSFVPDSEGTYLAILTANDAKALSLPDPVTVQVSGENFSPPNVVIQLEKKKTTTQAILIEPGETVDPGDTVFADGSQTSSLFPHKLLFEWTLIAKPNGSQTVIENPSVARARFYPDVPGLYTVRLAVEDGFHESFGEASIQVKTPDPIPPGGSASAAGGCSLVRR